jgi:hypothetical protein
VTLHLNEKALRVLARVATLSPADVDDRLRRWALDVLHDEAAAGVRVPPAYAELADDVRRACAALKTLADCLDAQDRGRAAP